MFIHVLDCNSFILYLSLKRHATNESYLFPCHFSHHHSIFPLSTFLFCYVTFSRPLLALCVRSLFIIKLNQKKKALI